MDKENRKARTDHPILRPGIRPLAGRPGRSRQWGFTLIELMVVIAIIAILASLVLSAVGKTRQSAHRVTCVNRFRQWAMAFIEYSDDHHGWIPRESCLPGGKVKPNTWADVVGRPVPGDFNRYSSDDVWYNALPNTYLQGVQPASYYFLNGTRGSFYEKRSFFHCPAARFSARAGEGLFAHFSMAMNSMLISPYNAPTIRITQLYAPSQTVLFLDNLLEGEKSVHPDQLSYDRGQPAAWATRFAGRRHGQTGNLAFADGHVDSLLGNKVVRTEGPLAGSAPLVGDIVWESLAGASQSLQTIAGFPIYD